MRGSDPPPPRPPRQPFSSCHYRSLSHRDFSHFFHPISPTSGPDPDDIEVDGREELTQEMWRQCQDWKEALPQTSVSVFEERAATVRALATRMSMRAPGLTAQSHKPTDRLGSDWWGIVAR